MCDIVGDKGTVRVVNLSSAVVYTLPSFSTGASLQVCVFVCVWGGGAPK